jgi:hypothetical protein
VGGTEVINIVDGTKVTNVLGGTRIVKILSREDTNRFLAALGNRN